MLYSLDFNDIIYMQNGFITADTEHVFCACQNFKLLMLLKVHRIPIGKLHFDEIFLGGMDHSSVNTYRFFWKLETAYALVMLITLEYGPSNLY